MYGNLLNSFESLELFTQIVIIIGIVFSLMLVISCIIIIIKILFSQTENTDNYQELKSQLAGLIKENQSFSNLKLRPKKLKTILLDLIEEDNTKALKIYLDLDFHLIDEKNLKSKKWWDQLDALLALDITLDKVQITKYQKSCLKSIQKLPNSSKGLIRSVSTKILFKRMSNDEIYNFFHNHESNPIIKDQLVLDAFIDHYKNKKKALFKIALEIPNARVTKIILKTIMMKKDKSAKELISTLIKDSKIKNTSNLKTLIKCAGSLKVTECKSEIEKYLTHDEASICSAALFSLSQIDPQQYDKSYFQSKYDLFTDKLEVIEVLNYLTSNHEEQRYELS